MGAAALLLPAGDDEEAQLTRAAQAARLAKAATVKLAGVTASPPLWIDGVLIPKPILAQLGLAGCVDLRVRKGVIEIRPIQRNPREGWAADARRLTSAGDGMPAWPEIANGDDSAPVW